MKIARVYVERLGWRVVPLHSAENGRCSCPAGENCKSGGKHPWLSDWAKEASDDPAIVEGWFTQRPRSNLGVATGEASGFFVLDVDTDHDGNLTLAELEEEHGELPLTVQAETGSGGSHYLFALPDFEVTNSAGKVGKGLDIRGTGGQIVVAPSKSLKGPYRWVHSPFDTEIADAPEWLLELIETEAPAATTTKAPARVVFPPASPEVLEQAREALEKHGPAIDGEGMGGGLHTVMAAAMLTHDFALTDEEAWPLLCEWNETCQPPWDIEADGGDDSLRERLRRGRKYGKGEYGTKRTADAVRTARAWIDTWRNEGEDSDKALELVAKIRALKFDDPAKRAVVEKELSISTGIGVRALALPPAHLKAEAKIETGPTATYDFDISPAGVPHSNLANVHQVLQKEKRVIWFDEFLQKVLVDDGDKPREWSDIDDARLARHMQRNLGMIKVSPQQVNTAVHDYAHLHKRDSVRDAFEGLKWDGNKRIALFFKRGLGAADNEYSRAASANFWKSMVVRVLRPGAKVDTMVVLEGPQGLKKSTAWQAAVGSELFAESSESIQSKDFFQALPGKLLVEIGEMDGFSKADVTAVKRVLSCQVDRYRPSYGRAAMDFPRRGIFVGSTNKDDWQRDDTGGRRFWPIRAEKIDVEWITAVREQCVAEAIAAIKAGETWWEMPLAATEAEQEERRQLDPWEDLIAEGVGNMPEVGVLHVLKNICNLPEAQMDRGAQMRVGSILKRLGYVRAQAWRDGKSIKIWKRYSVTSEA